MRPPDPGSEHGKPERTAVMMHEQDGQERPHLAMVGRTSSLEVISEGVTGSGGGNEGDEEPSHDLSTEGSSSPPIPAARGIPMYPPAPSANAIVDTHASQSSSSESGPTPRPHPTHSHHHHHPHRHQRGPSDLNSIASSSRLHELLSRQQEMAKDNSYFQPTSTLDRDYAGAPSTTSRRSRKSKGKGKAATDGHDSAATGSSMIHIAPIIDPNDSPFYPDSGNASNADDEGLLAPKAAPIRIRRVGALGISVSSDAGNEAINQSDGSTRRWSADEDERPGSTREGISDSHFRGIVDDLSLQNQALKGRLRRYEAARVPAQLKKERLFEVRFFDGMPSEKREEIEGFLTRYVQGLTDLPTFPSASAIPNPTSNSALPIHGSRKSTRDGSRSSRRRHDSKAVIPIPEHSVAAAESEDSAPSSDEQKKWAGPSFSGVEPTSLTGTGTGMRISSSGMERKRVAKDGAPLETRGDHKHAFEIVDVLEKFFEDTLTAMSTPKIELSGTNEAYLGHLLDNDSLAAGGWTYLNLVYTMSQVHRFNVTLPFIQTALRTYSTKLEVSADGAKVRWVGQKPVARLHAAGSTFSSAPSAHSSEIQSTSGSSDSLLNSKAQTVLGTVSTGATSLQHKSTSHPSHHIRPTTTPLQPQGPPKTILGAESILNAGLASTPKVASYVPFFTGSQESDDAMASSGPSSGDDRSTGAADGTGTVVFYSNQHFCSDLSTDVHAHVESNHPDVSLILGEERRPVVPDDGPSVFSSAPPPGWDDASPSTPGTDEDLEIFNGEAKMADDSPQVHEPSLLMVSGMTSVIPADFFTINVRTTIAPVQDVVSSASRKRSADSPVDEGRKRARILSVSTDAYESVVPAREGEYVEGNHRAISSSGRPFVSALRHSISGQH
ncbi:hypothetical protein P7C70_g4842, partial [Phenoliferia sp. Uapishka_3]